MNCGKNMKYFRVKAGLSQKEAASRLGINYYQLCNYEINRSEPNLDTLVNMSYLYNVSVDTLIKGEIDSKQAKNNLLEQIENNENLVNGLLDLVEHFKVKS